ncbi:hypothetical protein BCR42DRAFT_423019 [Absidia repens]|uniref:Uncharacterized protein n=1 Tax=Absidia repens TaxID=90262 RepID=A0A1X2I6A4_9FUNG|nr:hypothetical protein BCR42DRAFT_423019 [Absidia repens]
MLHSYAIIYVLYLSYCDHTICTGYHIRCLYFLHPFFSIIFPLLFDFSRHLHPAPQ